MICLYEPKVEDYWYLQKILNDKDTMSYNAGYNVSYDGYEFATGIIVLPKDKWQDAYDKRNEEGNYFAYIMDDKINKYVGYVAYYKEEDKYNCDIVVEASYRNQGYGGSGLELLMKVATDRGIDSLYDRFESSRENALNMFINRGFEIIDNITTTKFNNEEECVIVMKKLLD